MGIMSFLEKAVSSGRESTLLWQLFQENQGFARIAMNNFERVAGDRGIAVNSLLLARARIAANADRKLTIGKFLDSI